VGRFREEGFTLFDSQELPCLDSKEIPRQRVLNGSNGIRRLIVRTQCPQIGKTDLTNTNIEAMTNADTEEFLWQRKFTHNISVYLRALQRGGF